MIEHFTCDNDSRRVWQDNYEPGASHVGRWGFGTDKLVLTSAIKITVTRPAGTPIGQIMNEIRSWLDENGIEPVDFTTLVGREGIGFEIRLRTEVESERFQRAFG